MTAAADWRAAHVLLGSSAEVMPPSLHATALPTTEPTVSPAAAPALERGRHRRRRPDGARGVGARSPDLCWRWSAQSTGWTSPSPTPMRLTMSLRAVGCVGVDTLERRNSTVTLAGPEGPSEALARRSPAPFTRRFALRAVVGLLRLLGASPGFAPESLSRSGVRQGGLLVGGCGCGWAGRRASVVRSTKYFCLGVF
jgi:hypothetical protein